MIAAGPLMAPRIEVPGAPRPVGRVLLGYPVGSTELVPFAVSVRRLLNHEHDKRDQDRLLAGTVTEPGLYVDDNRNELAKKALTYPHVQWLFMVDTDIEFRPDVLDRMVALAEAGSYKVLAASVPIGDTWPTCAFRIGTRIGEWDPVQVVPREPIEVDGVATACVLIHREALEKVAAAHGRRWFERVPVPSGDDSITQGEDFSFCLRARDAGISIWCAHVPGVRHWKLAGYTHDDPADWPKPNGRRRILTEG